MPPEIQLDRPFRSYIRRHRRPFLLGLGALFLTNAFDALPPLLIGRAVDQLSGPRPQLMQTIAVLIGVTLTLSLFRYLWRLYWGRFHHAVADDLRNRLMDQFLKLGPTFVERHPVGKLMSLITNDINLFRMAIGPGILILLDGVFIILLVPPVMCTISVSWTLKSLCLMPLVPLFVWWIMGRLNQLYSDQQEKFSDMSGVAQEIIAGVRVIKSFAQERQQTRHFNRYNRYFEGACNRVARTDTSFGPLLELFVSAGTVILLLSASPEVAAGNVSIGQLLAFFQYVQRMIWPMTSIGVGLTHIQQGRSAFARIRDVLEATPEVRDQGTREITQFESLEVKDLTYDIGARRILHRISFRIERGQRLGLIGPTGAGKSILLDLILRVREPPPQTVWINGIPVEQLKLSSLRKIFGVVPQDVFLFQEPIAENLRYGHPTASDPQLITALTEAGLETELANFPDGLNTLLGERGTNLSGGQKQRMTLARSWVGAAPVLVLDDSLSAVDTRTEAQILDALDRLNTEQTLILVTHRIATLKNLSTAIVLNNGQIEAHGATHDISELSPTWQTLERIQMGDLA